MRETRQSGSEGGGGESNRLSLPLSRDGFAVFAIFAFESLCYPPAAQACANCQADGSTVMPTAMLRTRVASVRSPG
jgi:hypothetical protein